MNTILVIGNKGMAGHVIYNYFKETGKYETIGVSRDNMYFKSEYHADFSRTDQVYNILKASKPAWVINCAGLLNAAAESNPLQTVMINSGLPHFLAEKGNELGYRLLHISTDCVFNGKCGQYTEDDEPDGTGMYARSKALGEVAYGGHITLRTSIIGPELKQDGIGLFNWFMKQQGTIKGYRKAIWTGVTTLELARSIEKIINDNLSGLYHLANNASIDKYRLLLLFKEIFKKDSLHIEPVDHYISDKSLVNRNLHLPIPSYQQMVKEMYEWILVHPQLYPGYISEMNHLQDQ